MINCEENSIIVEYINMLKETPPFPDGGDLIIKYGAFDKLWYVGYEVVGSDGGNLEIKKLWFGIHVVLLTALSLAIENVELKQYISNHLQIGIIEDAKYESL